MHYAEIRPLIDLQIKAVLLLSAYFWAKLADGNLDNQGEIDAYYGVQLTPEIQIGTMLSIIFDPVRNPEKDRIIVWGFAPVSHCWQNLIAASMPVR